MAVAEKPSSDLYIGPAPAHMARRVLESRRKEVDKGLSYSFGLYEFDDIVAAIESHDMQLWNAIQGGEVIGVEVTEIIKYPRKKVCNLFLTAGKRLAKWGPQMLEQIEVFAKENGCEMMTGRGRKGWVRAAKSYGFGGEFMSNMKVL